MFRVKYSREVILKLLYQIDVTGNFDVNPVDLISDNGHFFKDLNQTETDFITDIITLILKDRDSIDKTIADNLIGWKIGRLTPIDRNLLRMGITESKKTGKKIIIIDDIVRIAKKYGGDDSFKIINAVLDKVIK
jgi:N utilization substance protein B